MIPSSLLLVGCGRMGGALLERWRRESGLALRVIDPRHQPGAPWHADLESLPDDYAPDTIVLAVKPQALAALLPLYRERFAAVNPLYLSIAAGKTLAFFAEHLGADAPVIRAMPNTPALVGQGVTALCASPGLAAEKRDAASRLLTAVGSVHWLEDEALMDAVTAISGCGPAYVFLFLEALAEAGAALGLPGALAQSLALETVAGSVALAAQSDKPLVRLRAEVASPGGATEAALAALLREDALKQLIGQAVQAARKRAQELSA